MKNMDAHETDYLDIDGVITYVKRATGARFSRTTAWRAVCCGQMCPPVHAIGLKHLWLRAHVDAWIARRKVAAMRRG
jgi:predicted DNA-binding transcriptional regulator AlpA